MKIELITCESGDWKVLKVDGKIYDEGHSIPDFVWVKLLQEKFGVAFEETIISDEDMEMGEY